MRYVLLRPSIQSRFFFFFFFFFFLFCFVLFCLFFKFLGITSFASRGGVGERCYFDLFGRSFVGENLKSNPK